MALVGMWGSFFSRKDGAAMRRPFRRVWSRIQLVVGTPVPPEQVTADGLAERVAALGGFAPPPFGDGETLARGITRPDEEGQPLETVVEPAGQ